MDHPIGILEAMFVVAVILICVSAFSSALAPVLPMAYVAIVAIFGMVLVTLFALSKSNGGD